MPVLQIWVYSTVICTFSIAKCKPKRDAEHRRAMKMRRDKPKPYSFPFCCEGTDRRSPQ